MCPILPENGNFAYLLDLHYHILLCLLDSLQAKVGKNDGKLNIQHQTHLSEAPFSLVS